jgi:hypothetical protein
METRMLRMLGKLLLGLGLVLIGLLAGGFSA